MAEFTIDSYLTEGDLFGSMAEDVRIGLTSRPRQLPPKYFYDARGSMLFEQITELPEYYPMRCESFLLRSIAPGLMQSLQPDEIVELGSGSSTKTRILLDARDNGHQPMSYVPMDVSESIIRFAARELLARYPDVQLHGVAGDFERHLDMLPKPAGKRLVLFLGGTLGNQDPAGRIRLLGCIRELLQPEDRLLLGVDLVKDPRVIELAYNDPAGVTAEFNRNILRVINSGLEGDFEPEAFEHVAFFNAEQSRIEMHLKPSTPQRVTLRTIDLTVEISPDETIWTESSYKFSEDSAREMLAAAGLRLESWHADSEPAFGLLLAAPASP